MIWKKLKYRIKRDFYKVLLLTDQALVSGGNFVLGIVLARTLGLSSYGEFSLSWLIVLFCSSIHQAWIINPMYTFYPKMNVIEKREYQISLLVHQFLFTGSIGVLAYLVLKLIHLSFPSIYLTGYIGPVSLAVLGFLMYDFVRKGFFLRQEIKKAILMDGMVYGLILVGVFTLSSSNDLSVASVLILLAAIYLSASVFLLPKLFGISTSTMKLKLLMKKHWNFSKWLIATSGLQWFSGNFFIVAAGSILNPAAVGAIRIIQNIIGLLHVVFMAMENYIPIKAAEIYHSQGLKQLSHFLRVATLKAGLMVALLIGLIVFFRTEIINLLYQGMYKEYAYLLFSFGILYLLVFLGTNYRFAIRTLEKTRAIFFAYVLSTITSVIAAPYFLNTWGIDGVVYGLIFTQLIMQGVFIFHLKSKVNLLWKSSILY